MARAYPLQRKPLRTSANPLAVFSQLAGFWYRRDLLWHMTVRHMRGQYKQSVLGYAWAFVNPLSQMVIMSFVFSTILKLGSQNGEPFPLFLFVGLVPWLFFSAALASGTDAVVGASSLVTKVYFPRELLPTAAVLTKLVDLFFGFVILAMLMAYYNQLPASTVYWFPLLFFIHMIFTLGLTLPLAALNLYYHDVRFLVGVVLTLWFYLTPVIYPTEQGAGQVPLGVRHQPQRRLYRRLPPRDPLRPGSGLQAGAAGRGHRRRHVPHRLLHLQAHGGGLCGQHLTARRSSSGT